MTDNQKIQQLREATVFGHDGEKIGKIGDVYLDDRTNEPTFATVNTGLFGSKQTFVPLDRAKFGSDRVEVPFDKDFVKDAPNIDDNGSLSPEEEQRLYEYYSLDDSGRTRGSQDERRHEGDRRHEHNDGAAEAGVAGTAAAGTAAAGHEHREHKHADDRAERREEREELHHDRRVANADEKAATRDAADRGTEDVVAHEEHLRATGQTERRQTGNVRLRKHVVTDTETVDVPVRREEISVERETIDPNSAEARKAGEAYDFDAKDNEREVNLTSYEERPVVGTETVATERVSVNKEVREDRESVSGEVRKERIDVEGDETREGKKRK